LSATLLPLLAAACQIELLLQLQVVLLLLLVH
jgi:hypothetical protein